MPVPLLDVNAQNHPLEAEFNAAFQRVFKSGQFIMGPDVAALESELCTLTGARHAITVSSGTDAILLALMALGIGPGDEVLLPTFTFFATAGCVSRVGATPVFVDSHPSCFNINLEDARAKITPRTKAIMPVHLFGQSADMEAVLALAKEFNLRVIEDGAQAIGAKYRGGSCGTLGDFGTFSFFPSKNLGGLGDSGAVVCNDDDLAEMTRVLRNHGMKPKYYHQFIGGNFRNDTLQAALLRVKIPHYPEYTQKRQANAAYYTKRLLAMGGVAQAVPGSSEIEPKAKIVLPVAHTHNEHIWNQYTLRLIGPGQRDAFREHMVSKKIGCEIYYPLTLDQQDCFANTPAASRQGCQVAHALAQQVASIPIYPELSEAQKDEVVAAIEEFVGK